MRLLDNLQYGWAYPRKAKKAHYFNKTENGRDVSACGKYSIGWTNGKAYIPISVFGHEKEMCKKCLETYNLTKLTA